MTGHGKRATLRPACAHAEEVLVFRVWQLRWLFMQICNGRHLHHLVGWIFLVCLHCAPGGAWGPWRLLRDAL